MVPDQRGDEYLQVQGTPFSLMNLLNTEYTGEFSVSLKSLQMQVTGHKFAVKSRNHHLILKTGSNVRRANFISIHAEMVAGSLKHFSQTQLTVVSLKKFECKTFEGRSSYLSQTA